MKLTDDQVRLLACENDIEYAILKAFIEVESGGTGFDSKTDKIIIQFEPHYFKRKEPFAPSGAWSINKVDVQSREWVAFNNAFRIDPDSAMESTSIGMMQVMGDHWKRLGFVSVGEMWDFAKVSEKNQIELGIRFIRTSPSLLKALKNKDWHMVATLYNGKAYKQMAKKWGREPYDISLRKAYEKYKVA